MWPWWIWTVCSQLPFCGGFLWLFFSLSVFFGFFFFFCLGFLGVCVDVGSRRIYSIIFAGTEVRLPSRWFSRSSFSSLTIAFFLILRQLSGSPWPFRDDRSFCRVTLYLKQRDIHPSVLYVWKASGFYVAMPSKPLPLQCIGMLGDMNVSAANKKK